ncbi:MAG: hypothetical protein AAF721_04015 [Myxococcota bacterium]
MLNCLQLEELEARLLEAPGLADSYSRRDADFAERLVAWLTTVEAALQQNRLPAAATIAALRTNVVAAGRGAIPAGVTVQGRPTKTKLRAAAAVSVLHSATVLLERVIEPDQIRHREAREMMQRIVALASAKALPGFGPRDVHVPDTARWQALRADNDVQGGAIQLEGMVGANDALVLLNRATPAGRPPPA